MKSCRHFSFRPWAISNILLAVLRAKDSFWLNNMDTRMILEFQTRCQHTTCVNVTIIPAKVHILRRTFWWSGRCYFLDWLSSDCTVVLHCDCRLHQWSMDCWCVTEYFQQVYAMCKNHCDTGIAKLWVATIPSFYVFKADTVEVIHLYTVLKYFLHRSLLRAME